MAGDVEDAKHQIALKLQSDDFLNALAAIDIEKDDGTSTAQPTQIFEGEKVNISDSGYPVCELIAYRSRYDVNTDAKDVVHEVHIFWTQAGDDELTITRDLERLMRATRDVFWPQGAQRDPFIGTNWSTPLILVSEDYTHLAPKINKTGFIKGSWMVVLVHTISV